MKLLRCNLCGDVFSITYKTKTCTCGESSGVYFKDGINAQYKGNCTPIGFANNSFRRALDNQPLDGAGKEFLAFVIPEICPTIKRIL